MEVRWAVRSTGCRGANCDAGGTALLGLRKGWGRADTQRARGCVLLALRLATGRSLQSPLSGHLLGLEPAADAGGAGFPPPHHVEVVLPGLHLQVTAQSGAILLNWSRSFLCWDGPS